MTIDNGAHNARSVSANLVANLRRVIACTAFVILALPIPSPAQEPIWSLPTDHLTVVAVGRVNGLNFAIVRDSAMRGHNTYCVTVGAHFGKASVVRIARDGVLLSTERLLPISSAQVPPNRASSDGP